MNWFTNTYAYTMQTIFIIIIFYEYIKNFQNFMQHINFISVIQIIAYLIKTISFLLCCALVYIIKLKNFNNEMNFLNKLNLKKLSKITEKQLFQNFQKYLFLLFVLAIFNACIKLYGLSQHMPITMDSILMESIQSVARFLIVIVIMVYSRFIAQIIIEHFKKFNKKLLIHVVMTSKCSIQELSEFYDELNELKIMFNDLFGIYITIIITEYFVLTTTSTFYIGLAIRDNDKRSKFYVFLIFSIILPMVLKFILFVKTVVGFPMQVNN